MTKYEVKIESDEDGFRLIIGDGDGERYTFLLEDPEALYDTVKREIGPWLYERDMAQKSRPFLCSAEDIDESGGYAADDPKGPRFHSTHIAIWDERAGK